MSIENSGQMRRLVERIKDEDTRRVIEEVLKASLSSGDVRKVISQTTFGFQESEGDDGGKEVTLNPIQGENVQLPNRPPFEDARRPHNL